MLTTTLHNHLAGTNSETLFIAILPWYPQDTSILWNCACWPSKLIYTKEILQEQSSLMISNNQIWPSSVLLGSGHSQLSPVQQNTKCQIWFVEIITKTG